MDWMGGGRWGACCWIDGLSGGMLDFPGCMCELRVDGWLVGWLVGWLADGQVC